jgi:hypothetical protein
MSYPCSRQNFHLQWWLWSYHGWDSWKFLETILSWSNAKEDCEYLYKFLMLLIGTRFLFYILLDFLWLLYLVIIRPIIQAKCMDVLGVSDCLTQYVWRTHQMSLQGRIRLHNFLFFVQYQTNKVEWTTHFSISTPNCHQYKPHGCSSWETKYWMAKSFAEVKFSHK